MPSRNVYVQTSMGGFTAHDYVCNTIKENGIICVEKMEAGGLRKFFSIFEITKPTLVLRMLCLNELLKTRKLDEFKHSKFQARSNSSLMICVLGKLQLDKTDETRKIEILRPKLD